MTTTEPNRQGPAQQLLNLEIHGIGEAASLAAALLSEIELTEQAVPASHEEENGKASHLARLQALLDRLTGV
jgi:hypothetical protein